jgi:hypothetical protein
VPQTPAQSPPDVLLDVAAPLVVVLDAVTFTWLPHAVTKGRQLSSKIRRTFNLA